jgi:phosphoribosylglycinamide formyltransferase-1
MRKIAVFSSGNGTNAENLIRFFKSSPLARVELVVTNNPSAGLINRAKELGVPAFVFQKGDLTQGEKITQWLLSNQIDLVVLAGFLLKIPHSLINAFEQKIINIHPSLLPKFGGKGMYGNHVHAAVLSSGEKESGITVHLVNEEYDKGEILARFSIPIPEGASVDELAKKIHLLEYEHFPKVVVEYLERKFAST